MQQYSEFVKLFKNLSKSRFKKINALKCGKIAIISTHWNKNIVSNLLKQSIMTFNRLGIEDKNIQHFLVPGAWEIPQLANNLFSQNACDSLLTIGCIIKGETPHFEIISTQSSEALLSVAMRYSVPTINGILTTNSIDQAESRVFAQPLGKGEEFAISLVLLCKVWQRQ
ncbi:MAG: 6,7-dimethyl-8-ribityllumazine synthase [Methylacidiphilales bacterium]|nr:6,7-dimethyl-8-ribityllumazine synthase [Candidatus Methylacidiphilales bacterium]